MKDYCTQEVLYVYYENQISNLLAINKKKEAQTKAFEWLQEYVRPLCITVPWNWKIAKKQIAAYFFGKTQSIQINFEDHINKGLQFIESHPNQNIRYSYHRYDTACHSESQRVNNDTIERLSEIKKKMQPMDIIEIFTECSTCTTTCFRRFSLQYNESISYEMGYGQAMYVFEAERGKHDIAAMDYHGNKWKINKSVDPFLTKYLERLINNHEQYLSIKSQCICYYLGIPQISIEGYFDTAIPNEKPIIVDIDLPFDRAFF